MRRSISSRDVSSPIPGMYASAPLQGLAILAVAVIATVLFPRPADAIEMFTFFGDGSRVPLPSLETPIEAYPGIPLRSDRLRARRRAASRVPPQTGMPVGNGRITIRTMPATEAPSTFDDGIRVAPAPETIQTPPPTQTRGIRWRRR
ncbi:MAG: hypothetical protein ABGW75_02825 [Pirellulales bacterium]